MSNNNDLQIKLKQTQQLSQGLQQSLRLLQMSSIEIEREIEDWLQENPLLEREELPEYAYQPSRSITANISKTGISLDDEENESAWENLAAKETLNDYLHKQVCEHPLTEEEAFRVHILIDFLDEKGYLTDTIEEIIENTPLEWQLDEENMEIALEHLRNFDPVGVATYDLTQSLLYQLDRLPVSTERKAAAQIVMKHLKCVSQNIPKSVIKIKKLLPEYNDTTLREACEMIQSLNPYPSYGFADEESTHFIRPDVYIERDKKGWRVISNETAWPQISVNRELTDALQSEKSLDSEWRQKIASAKQKINMLQQRKSTVMRVAEYILENQKDFFVFGEIGLMPLRIKDCAQALELAESTISRAVSNKYLACPQGLFPLRYFFTQNVVENNGEGISAHAIKSVMEQMIANEDKKKPLSDFAIHELLQQQGINIARRTVAKYREQLGLPTVQQRRET